MVKDAARLFDILIKLTPLPDRPPRSDNSSEENCAPQRLILRFSPKGDCPAGLMVSAILVIHERTFRI